MSEPKLVTCPDPQCGAGAICYRDETGTLWRFGQHNRANVGGPCGFSHHAAAVIIDE